MNNKVISNGKPSFTTIKEKHSFHFLKENLKKSVEKNA